MKYKTRETNAYQNKRGSVITQRQGLDNMTQEDEDLTGYKKIQY